MIFLHASRSFTKLVAPRDEATLNRKLLLSSKVVHLKFLQFPSRNLDPILNFLISVVSENYENTLCDLNEIIYSTKLKFVNNAAILNRLIKFKKYDAEASLLLVSFDISRDFNIEE